MYQLYYYPGNANLAPHMFLEELGVPFELVLVDRDHDAHKQAAYLKLNPSGRIPVLIDGDMALSETAAICLHLADRHAESGYTPALGTPERAQYYRWMSYLSTTLQTELITYFYPERLTNDDAGAAVVKRHAETRVGAMLDLIETALAQNAQAGHGPYLLGTRFTALDPYLLMLARWTRGFGYPARARPQLAAFLALMVARPAVQRAFASEALVSPLY